MVIRILFWFIIFYLLFKFLFKFVLPVVIATRKVRSKIKEMNEEAQLGSNGQPGDSRPEAFQPKETSPASKGDYIDFEEIK
jgi:hypothetical protein